MNVNTQTLAECLGVSKRQIGKLTEDGVIVRVSRGSYDLGVSIKGYIEFRIAGTKSKRAGRSLESVKTEHELLKMRKTELHVKLMEGQLHRAKDVEQIWTAMAAAVKGRLLGIPVKLAPQLEGLEDRAEIQKKIAREVEDALNEIAAYDPADYATSAQEEQEEAAKEDEEDETPQKE